MADDRKQENQENGGALPATDDATPTPDGQGTSRKQVGRKRISRWDRPPEPHDWRWVVGHIGRALITIGLLMFGFVAYQLWGTGIETARAQNHLDNEFEELFDEAGITPDTLAPAGATDAPVTVPATTPPIANVPVATVPPTEAPASDTTPTAPDTTPATTAEAPTTTAVPIEQDYGDIHPGDVLMQLTIPAIGIDWKVVAGVTVKDLAKGPGHFPDTPLPGQLGNSAIAGHRTGHGGPFYDLDELDPGDEIQIRTRIGGAYAYIVTDSLVVAPSDYEVITNSNPEVATLTLVTCTPKGTSSQRLVVHATLDPTCGSPVGLPLIFYGDDAPSTPDSVLPADDTAGSVTPATEPSVSNATGVTDPDDPATTSPTTVGTVAAAVITSPDTTPTIDTSATDDVNEFAGDNAFSQGWFDDSGAWLDVVLWAAALALVAYGSYRVAKRYRRLYLAFVVGFIPFVVVLYFFYQNVNRLLPAAI